MFSKPFRQACVLASALLAASGVALKTAAAPADIFASQIDRVRQSLPPQFAMRLPAKILLGGPADDEFIQSLTVRVFESDSPAGLTVALFSCGEGTPFCLIGTFDVASRTSAIVQQALKQHITAATPIRLTPSIRGYLLEGSAKHPPTLFSSVMWQQDGMIYSVSFPVAERQNLLYMAASMANAEPIYALNPELRDLPAKTMR